MNADQLKHLEFIQNVITRMNTNSFQIKGWAMTIVAALLAVYASTKIEALIWIGLLPTVVFWFLDAFYLSQERKYRGLYNDAAGVSDPPIAQVKLFSMDTRPYKGGSFRYLRAFFSRTLVPLYLSIIVFLVGFLFYLC